METVPKTPTTVADAVTSGHLAAAITSRPSYVNASADRHHGISYGGIMELGGRVARARTSSGFHAAVRLRQLDQLQVIHPSWGTTKLLALRMESYLTSARLYRATHPSSK